MSVVKSDLIKELAENYPNFLKKDLIKLFDISIREMLEAIKRDERVEIRSSLGVFYTKIQKARISRNPRTGQKVNTPQKRTILFKCSKYLFKKLNNE